MTDATSFADLGVSDAVLKQLGERGISEAFPIQAATIEAALSGRDICGKAPTGSGKTLAFGIPVVDLTAKGKNWRPRALILAPTRELATQIKEELEPLARANDRTIVTVFGGTNIERDIRRLEKGVDILVACPGRLEDLIGRRCCELRDVDMVVVDEADRMADMGFLPSVKRILDQVSAERHTQLFSATLDGDVEMLIKRYQKDPLTFEIEEQAGDIGDVEHSWYLVQPNDRIQSAVAVLRSYYSSIVFCRTRRGCDRVAKTFAGKGLSAVAIHGDRSQGQRERALKDFTSGKAQVLVATDVAARGIHVDNVALVMHYDPAGSDKDYIHRSGRTGRAGQDGRVISMVVEDKKKTARQLQKDLGMKPGFDDFDRDSLPAVVERPKYVPEPKPERTKRDDSGSRRDRAKGRGGDSAGGSGERADRNERRKRRDAEGDGPSRGGQSRGGRSEGGKSRGDRSQGGKSRGDSPRGRGRDDRNGRGGRDPRARDDDRSSSNRGARKTFDSDDRETPGKRSRLRPTRKAPGSKDWFPPGYYDDDKRGGRKGADKKRSSGSSRSDDRDEKREDEPVGGSGTEKRKDRSTKGRHADKTSNKNKGKRRSPRKK